MEPTWSNFPDFLIERFPQLKESVEESYFDWRTAVEDPAPHVFLHEILGPLLLTDGTREHADLSLRAGEVLDELLTCSDYELAEAALTSIVEVLRDSDELRANAWPSLGPTAREWLAAAQRTRRPK
jgi:hypothetical protein